MKMLLSSLILLSGLSFVTAACSPTEDPVNTEEPTPPNRNRVADAH